LKYFVHFLEDLKTPKFSSDINWSLAADLVLARKRSKGEEYKERKAELKIAFES
jgi:hypothetical protein